MNSVTIPTLVRAAAKYYRLRDEQIYGRGREPKLVRPRHVVMYLARKSGYPLTRIGHFFGGRDHTSIRYAVDRVASDAILLAECQEVLNSVPGNDFVFKTTRKKVS